MEMLSSRVVKASVLVGALLLAAVPPAMAVGGPAENAGGPGGPSAAAAANATSGPAAQAVGHGNSNAAKADNPGVGAPQNNPGADHGRPVNPGGGGGKPDNPGGGGGKPGGETAGNNLSFPVQWSEDTFTVALPGTMGEVSIEGTVLEGTNSTDDPTPCMGAVQKDENNSWQADSAYAVDNAVTTIDWGDNLESKDWKLGTVVRVETGLYDSDLPAQMTRYEMCYISGSGTDEVWGLRVTGSPGEYTPVSLESDEAMVYTAGARLTIQQIVPGSDLTWDAATHAWTGDGAFTPVVNMAAHERTSDGPGSYGAELNVGGKIVYGFVWKTAGLAAGEYRLTFSLDHDADFESGVTLAGADILTTVEAEVAAAEEGGGNTAYVDDVNDLTYIDVGLVASGGSGT